ncbi:MAG: S8 family serine peptidase [Acidimicrobiales bacterium]
MRAAVAAVAAALIAIIVPVFVVPTSTADAAPGTPALSGAVRLLVAFDPEAAPSPDAAHRQADATLVDRVAAIDLDIVTVDDVKSAIASYEARDDVRYVEVDQRVHALAPPPDNAYDQQWNFHPSGPANPASINWQSTYESGVKLGDGIRVAVVDSGYRPNGTDAPANVNTADDWDYARGDATPDDENGHGTHVIGTIAQLTGNPGTKTVPSVVGVAPNSEIVPIKVLEGDGSGSVSAAIAGVNRAVSVGARVINLSLGGPYSKAFCDAIASAATSAVVVVASGNEASPGFAPVSWPASCPGALAVGGLRHNGTRGGYSNGGCTLAVTAPGGELSDRMPNDKPFAILQESFDSGGFGHFFDTGTSMAAAHVSGAAAVLLSQPSNPSAARVRDALRSTARDLGRAGPDPEFGSGAIDLAAALAGLPNPPPRATKLGYWEVASDGGIFAFGDAPFFGSTGAITLNKPIVAMSPTPTGRGYWLTASDGGIFAFGDAEFYGSTGNIKLNQPIVAMRPTSTGGGYWLTASDGGIFAFGDAEFHGSTGGIAINSPIVAMETTPVGGGYWLTASDGGIFAFGNADYKGSTGGIAINKPIVAMAATLTGQGYWLVASDGGIFAFGDAKFHGLTGAIQLNSPIVGMAPTCRSDGYWLVAADGGLFAFGDAPFLGSMGGTRLTKAVVGMARAIDQR